MARPTLEQKIGDTLREARGEACLSAMEVAQKVGYKSERGVHYLESGVSLKWARRFLKLCKLYGISPNEVLGWEER